jgi:hypothetical protein
VFKPSKKLDPFIKINKQKVINISEKKLFLSNKSIKNIFVEKMRKSLRNINKKIIIN